MMKKMRKKHYFIDLFAGCGGLSLGLEMAGFDPVYVNELDKDAMESYLINRDETHPYLREKYNSSDIFELTVKREALNKLASNLKKDFGINSGDLDLVVGGPPCQGYSGIGHRRSYSVDRKDVPSNYLYKEMVKVIRKVKPKAFMFENVGGLMFARWTSKGDKGEIWKDVRKSFESILNYRVRWQLIRAKDYGVPQNRPRILVVGLRKDIKFNENKKLPAGGLLPSPTKDFPNPKELLGDLVDPHYMKKDSTEKYLKAPSTRIQKKLRTSITGTVLTKGSTITEHQYSKHSEKIRKKFDYMIKHKGTIPKEMRTKKFAQRVLPTHWNGTSPNITATSLPDDYVHFSQPRILTVREWARLQTFPDWYKFAGKRTTGGTRRAGNPKKGVWGRELPKYTQIGNAVPVKLAEEIGRHLKKIIS